MMSSTRLSGDDMFPPFVEGGGPPPGSMHKSSLMKEPSVERKVPCSLEELYKGTTKRMRISREVVDANGIARTVEEILTINIEPGSKKGAKIVFPEKGNEKPNVIPADLVIIIDQKPHRVFAHEENDLVVTQKITLAEALTGCLVHLTTLDGRNLTIPINNIIHPTYEEIVKGEGMPLSEDPSAKGNLRIKFVIQFPTRLTSNQKANIKELLGF